jgi:S-disulfanyl-L-cysteine oxidoreductase SoxD
MYTREMYAFMLAGGVVLGGCATQGMNDLRALKSPGLGERPSAAEIAAVDISIPPSGAGLPPGSGDARTGAKVYAAKCQVCHGEKGAGKPADPLAGGIGSLASASPVRTVGSYWPYATTLFDYTRRAMPTNAPRTLTDDEVYAVTAYVLYLNGIIGETHVLNAQTLAQVKMPNRSGFVDRSHVR